MANLELALVIAFYAYPVILFLTLFAAQSIQFYVSRLRPRSSEQPSPTDNKRRIYSTLIWLFQLAASGLLFASIVVVVYQAIAIQDASSAAAFPFSAYLVPATISLPNDSC